jgi:hypothetical protein
MEIHSIGDFLAAVFDAIGLSLGLNPNASRYINTETSSIAVVVTVAFIAGVSLLLGQSVVLFLNRVTRTRFIVSLALNGALYVVNLLIWSTVIWGIGRLAFDVQQPIGIAMMAVLLGSAPFVFGFFILVPYLGLLFSRVLYAWSLLATVVMVESAFGIGWLRTTLCVGLGWLVLLLIDRTVGRPIVIVRDRVLMKLTGVAPYAQASQLGRTH